MDDNGQMKWGVEVEPPEDMDDTGYSIDPQMRIWKSMTGNRETLKAEEDMDELYHPSVADILKIQTENLGSLLVADIQAELVASKYNREPEEDKDDIDHPDFSELDLKGPEQDLNEIYQKTMEELHGYLAPLRADYRAGTQVQISHYEPEKDEVKVSHRDNQYSAAQVEPLIPEVRVHHQPEEDMEDLYHMDVAKLIAYQGDAEAAVPFDEPSQRRHSEAEEDLDYLYHQ